MLRPMGESGMLTFQIKLHTAESVPDGVHLSDLSPRKFRALKSDALDISKDAGFRNGLNGWEGSRDCSIAPASSAWSQTHTVRDRETQSHTRKRH
jgi:hypothetical protein